MPLEKNRKHEWQMTAIYRNQAEEPSDAVDMPARFVAVEVCKCFHMWELGMCGAIRFTEFGLSQIFPGATTSYSGIFRDKPTMRAHIYEDCRLLDGNEEWLLRTIDAPQSLYIQETISHAI